MTFNVLGLRVRVDRQPPPNSPADVFERLQVEHREKFLQAWADDRDFTLPGDASRWYSRVQGDS